MFYKIYVFAVGAHSPELRVLSVRLVDSVGNNIENSFESKEDAQNAIKGAAEIYTNRNRGRHAEPDNAGIEYTILATVRT